MINGDLIRILADGRFHSGSELGAALQLTRAAVWKQVEALRDIGLNVHAVKGRGYRLAAPLDLLDVAQIKAELPSRVRDLVSEVEVLLQTDSTNRVLLNRRGNERLGQACLAEMQTAGRGRRGRSWISPFGANIYLSVAWRFERGPAGLFGLSPAIAVGICDSLEEAGADALTLKWPNDVLHKGAKAAGILLELSGEADGPCYVVAGVGMNVGMPAAAAAAIEQPWADVRALLPHADRNRLAALLIASIAETMQAFDADGLEPFLSGWHRRDAFVGADVRLHLPRHAITGRARGIDRDGALLIEDEGGAVRRFASGEVTLRAMTDIVCNDASD